MNLDKNFRPWNVKKEVKPVFTPLIKQSSIPNRITPWLFNKYFSTKK